MVGNIDVIVFPPTYPPFVQREATQIAFKNCTKEPDSYGCMNGRGCVGVYIKEWTKLQRERENIRTHMKR